VSSPSLLVTGHELMVRGPYQMRTSKRVESSRAQRRKTVAGDLTTPVDLCNTISTSKSDQGGSRQPMDDSHLTPRALHLETGNQGTSLAAEGKRPAWALQAMAPPQVTTAVVAGSLAFQTPAEGHNQESVPSRVDDSTTYRWISDHPTAMGRDENALPQGLGSDMSFAYGEYHMPQDAHDMGSVVAVPGVTDFCSLSADYGRPLFASPIIEPQHWHLFDSSAFKVGPDAEIDTEVDPSIPMEEDKVGTLPSTTFDLHLAYQPPPYIQDVNVEQNDIITDNGPEFVEDSAMEYAGEEHREVEATMTVAQTIQQPPLEALVIPHVVSNAQLCGSIQTAPHSSNWVHPFQSTMSSNLYTLDGVVPESASFARVVPPQEIASLFVSDGAPSSTPTLGVETLKEQGIAISNTSPTPELIVVASHTTSYSPSSLSSASPPRDGSAPISLSSHGAIWEQNREVEELAVPVGLPPTVVSIQDEGSPLRYVRISLVMWCIADQGPSRSPQRRNVADCDGGATQGLRPCSPANSNDSLLSTSGVGTAMVNYSSSIISATPIKNKQDADEEENKDCTDGDELCVIYTPDPYFSCSLAVCRDREEGQLAVTHLTQKGSPCAPPTAIIKLAPPAPIPVPIRVAGCKRKFTDDQDVWCNSISPTRKISDIPCVIFSFLIRFTY
jgi:hypothetical protein